MLTLFADAEVSDKAYRWRLGRRVLAASGAKGPIFRAVRPVNPPARTPALI